MSKLARDKKAIPFDEGWKHLEEKAILPFVRLVETKEQDFYKASDFVHHYDHVFKMCTQQNNNHSSAMYEKYCVYLRKYITETVSPMLIKEKEKYDNAFLKAFAQAWENLKTIVKGLSNLIGYLDRFYVPATKDGVPTKLRGFQVCKEVFFDGFCEQARTIILNSINKERESEDQDRDLLKRAVAVFEEVGREVYKDDPLKIYKKDLEDPLCAHAEQFFAAKSRFWIEQNDMIEYLKLAEEWHNKERSRVTNYLNSSTMDRLVLVVYTQLCKIHQQTLLEKKTGVVYLLTENREKDLERLYTLYAKHPDDLPPIAKIVNDHIREEGFKVVDAVKEQKSDENNELVRNLIALHERFAGIVKGCFQNSQVFQKALKSAFEEFINKDTRVSNLLAKYSHSVLKKGVKLTSEQVEATLGNIVFLYGYIQDKDVFEREYQLFLSDRLLNDKCDSEHAEKSMIAKLKTECGYQWTNKLEGMFKDIQLSKELLRSFQKLPLSDAAAAIALSVNVCTTGYWPSTKVIPHSMPKPLVPVVDAYKTFYLNQHNGRKLEWRMDKGEAEVEVRFSPKVKKLLVCTTIQMMIMLIFATEKATTYRKILDITRIPAHDLDHHLLNLAHPKVGILEKKPNSKELEDSHMFRVNPKFASRQFRIPVPQLVGPVQKKGVEDEEAKYLKIQRRNQTDASIVRIMKTRKTLKHPNLVAEVVNQLSARFKPKPNNIKKRIEALIEQGYLARDENDRTVYNYLA